MKIILYFLLLMISSFQVSADNLSDSNRLFDWAEENFPEYFSPACADTFEIDVYLTRHYADTNIYIGTSGNDVYVHGDIFGGLLHVGMISDFISIENTSTLEDYIVGKRINIGATDSVEFNYDGTSVDRFVENGTTYTVTGTYDVEGLVVTITYTGGNTNYNHHGTYTFNITTPTAGDTFAAVEYTDVEETIIDYSNPSTPVSSIEDIGNTCL